MSVVEFPALVGARVGSAFDEIFRDKAPAQVDAASVGKVVAHFALDIGCSESNILAAVRWAIRNGHDTLSAIKCGKTRAEQLRIRELSAAVRRA
jgi:hypothetical protein